MSDAENEQYPLMPNNPLEPLTPETPGCGAIYMNSETGRAWRCCQPECDGERHYFRRLMWIGPFLSDDEEPDGDIVDAELVEEPGGQE